MIRTPALKYLSIALIAASASVALGTAGLGPDYDVLSRKDIFSKNRISNNRDSNSQRNNNKQGRTQRRSYTPILIGSMLEDDGYVAFIVDPESRNITTVRAGDVLPGTAGTLKEATLDYIVTDPGNGKPPTRVLMGQNILGGVAEYPDPNAEASADTSSGPSTQPSAGGPPGGGNPGAAPAGGAPSGGAVDDIVARLRAKRLQQLGK